MKNEELRKSQEEAAEKMSLMRGALPLFALVASIGVSLTAGSSAELAVTAFATATVSPDEAQRSRAAAPLELQKRPVPPKIPIPNKIPIPAKNPIPVSANSLKAGRAIYAKICRACHGLRGRGDGVSAPPGSKPASLVDGEWKYGGSDPEIFRTIKGGIEPYDVMEPWGRKISDNDIWNTVNFLRDLAKGQKVPAKK